MRCIFSRFLIHIHPVIAKEGRQYRLYLRNLALLQLRYWTSGNFSFLFPQGIGLEEVNLLVCHCYRKKPIIDVILQCRFSRKHLMSVITQWKLALEKKKGFIKANISDIFPSTTSCAKDSNLFMVAIFLFGVMLEKFICFGSGCRYSTNFSVADLI